MRFCATKVDVPYKGSFIISSLALWLEIDRLRAPVINLGYVTSGNRWVYNLTSCCLFRRNLHIVLYSFTHYIKCIYKLICHFSFCKIPGNQLPVVVQSLKYKFVLCPSKLRSRQLEICFTDRVKT